MTGDAGHGDVAGAVALAEVEVEGIVLDVLASCVVLVVVSWLRLRYAEDARTTNCGIGAAGEMTSDSLGDGGLLSHAEYLHTLSSRNGRKHAK